FFQAEDGIRDKLVTGVQTCALPILCVCGCNQVLLECNHVGCAYSDRMRGELAAGVERSESDDLTLQTFVQKYGPTVLIAPTSTRSEERRVGKEGQAGGGAHPEKKRM